MNKNQNRSCINPACTRVFSECNGFVIARDVLEHYEGRREAKHIRERCGACVLFFETRPEQFEAMLRENPFPKDLSP